MSSKINTGKSKNMDLPSKSEQLSLQNTEILLKSNLMRMQLNELLSNVRDSQTAPKHNKIDKWLDSVCDILKSCKKGLNDNELSGKWLGEKGLRGFNLEGPGSDNISLTFEKPSSIQLIGSFALGTATSPILNCDIAVVMPKNCFDARDVVNHIYFNKRKLYLSGLSEVLSSSGLCSSIEISNFKSDTRKPFLLLKPNFKTKYSVRLYPCAPSGVFKLIQLISSKNNVRPDSWMRELQIRSELAKTKGKGKISNNSSSSIDLTLDPSTLAPTPYYNMAILEDLAIVPQSKMLLKASDSCPCFKDVCIMLKVWLAQKNIRFGINDLDGHDCQIIVAYLYQSRRIGQQTTALGAFQIVLGFLSDTNFTSNELHFIHDKNNEKNEKNSNNNIWPATLYHPVGKDVDDVQFNSLWRISHSALQDIQNEAKIALQLMQVESDISFCRVFLEKKQYLSRYDLIFHTPLDTFKNITTYSNYSSDSSSEKSNSEYEKTIMMCNDMTIPQYLSSKILSICQRALTNRVKLISVSIRDKNSNDDSIIEQTSVSSWATSSAPTSQLNTSVITVGLVLDNEYSHRRVDKGIDTSIEQSEEEIEISGKNGGNFQSFWGNKSELRRFKDGTIVDAVVWSESDMAITNINNNSNSRDMTGESIVECIVRYSLGLHLSIYTNSQNTNNQDIDNQNISIISLGGTLEELLPSSNYIKENNQNYEKNKIHNISSKIRYLHAVEAMDNLRSILTSDIKDLPLVFESIQGCHSSLRYTSMLPPLPNPLLLNTKDKLKEYSGVSLSLITQPMLIIGQVEGGGKWPSEVEAAKKVKTALLLRTAHLLRVQFEISSQPFHEHLDIFYKGYAFRLVIYFSTEISDSYSIRRLQSATLHHQTIRALHTQHSDPFSTCVRLLSLWLSKNYFSGFLTHKQIELLCAAVFLDNSLFSPPTTSSSAFFRVLELLAKHDFNLSPIVVSFMVENDKNIAENVNNMKRNLNIFFDTFQASFRGKTSSLIIFSSDDFISNNSSNNGNNDNDKNDGNEINSGVDNSHLSYDNAIEKVSLSLIQRCARESALKLTIKTLNNNSNDTSNNTNGNSNGNNNDNNKRNNESNTINNGIFNSNNILYEQCNIILHFTSSLHCKDTNNNGLLGNPKYASLKIYANTSVQPHSNTDKLIFGETYSNSINIIQEDIIEKLRFKFQDIAIFFWDETKGDKIVVLFKPSSFISSTFSSTSSRRKFSIFDNPSTATTNNSTNSTNTSNDSTKNTSNLSIFTDISQIASEMFLTGNGSFSDITFN